MSIRQPDHNVSQLGFQIFHPHHFLLLRGVEVFSHLFHLDKLVVVVKAVRVEQGAAGLDLVAGNNLLDGEFYFLEVDRGLVFFFFFIRTE